MDLEPKQAIEILSQRGDQIAKSLGVEEGAGWRDNTGTAHLLIRGAFQSLERIKAGIPSIDDASIAIGTVGFAGKSPEGFLANDVSKVAEVAKKILTTEMASGFFEDAITPAELEILTTNLASFRDDIVGQAGHIDADPSLKSFAGALDVANKYYQKISQEWKADIAPSSDGPGNSGIVYKPGSPA